MSSPRSLRRKGKLSESDETLGQAIQREIPSPRMTGRAIRDAGGKTGTGWWELGVEGVREVGWGVHLDYIGWKILFQCFWLTTGLFSAGRCLRVAVDFLICSSRLTVLSIAASHLGSRASSSCCGVWWPWTLRLSQRQFAASLLFGQAPASPLAPEELAPPTASYREPQLQWPSASQKLKVPDPAHPPQLGLIYCILSFVFFGFRGGPLCLSELLRSELRDM